MEECVYCIVFKDFVVGFVDFKDASDAFLMFEYDCVEDELKF